MARIDDDFDSERETHGYDLAVFQPRRKVPSVSGWTLCGMWAATLILSLLCGWYLAPTTPAISHQNAATELSRVNPTNMPFDHKNSMAASAALPASTRLCVYRVRTEKGSGSAVAIATQCVITARHVVEGSSAQVELDIYDVHGTFRSINGTVIALDDESDLALIRVSEDLPAVAVLGLDEARNALPGDPLVCVGATAGGTAWNSTAGYLSARGAPEINNTFWQMSVPIFFGNSGGAVYEAKTFKLIGISVAMNSFCSSYFIPAHTIQAFILRAASTPQANIAKPKAVDGQTATMKECIPGEPIQPFIPRREK
jgi:S1-C subfamily serine protease